MLSLQCDACGQRNAGWRANCKRCGNQLQRFFAPWACRTSPATVGAQHPA